MGLYSEVQFEFVAARMGSHKHQEKRSVGALPHLRHKGPSVRILPKPNVLALDMVLLSRAAAGKVAADKAAAHRDPDNMPPQV